jgi:outer membrane cobalamin receptor
MKSFCFTLLFACLLIPAWAEGPVPDKPADPPPDAPAVIHTEIEVTAPAPLVEGNSLTPSLVTFSRVTRHQLDDLLVADMLTGLRQVPGVVISRYNPVGSYGGADGGTLYIRGLGSGRPGGEILFQVDGAPIYSGVWAHPLMDVLSVDAAGSIDVIKGASPVLYGNGAYGVVDIHTRRMETEGTRFDAMGAGGSFRSLALEADAGWRQGRWDATAVASYRRSDGHREHSAGELQSCFGQFGVEPAPGWRFDATLSRTGNYALDPGPKDQGPPLQGQFNTDDWTTVLTVENSSSALSGYSRFYLNDGAIRWQQWDAAGGRRDDSNTDYRNWGLRFRQAWQASDRLTLRGGLDWDVYGGSFVHVLGDQAIPKETLTFWNAAPYLQVQGQFGTKTLVQPVVGVRWNHSRYFGDIVAPEAGLSVVRGGTRFHVTGSRGFNLPGVYAAFQYEDWNQGASWQDLKAERIWHLEGGVSHAFSPRVQADVTLFHDRGTDALRFAAPPPHFDNIGAYTTQGVELTGHLLPDPRLNLFAGYTWLRATPSDLPNAPAHSASFGANWHPRSRWQFSLDGQYLSAHWGGNTRYPGRTRLDGFFVLNGRCQWDVAPDTWRERIVLFLEAENLTDVRYEYRPGYPMPGLTFWAGARLSLKR